MTGEWNEGPQCRLFGRLAVLRLLLLRHGPMTERQWPVITVLGITQTLSWASSYYIPAVLADTIAKDLSISTVWIFGAFSVSLLISALLGPRIGRQIDAFGGNGVLAASNLMIAGGLVLLGSAQGLPMLCAAWLVLGFGMGFGLYDSAFAALGRIYGANARRAITGITLIAGFASTVGWPLTAWGAAEIGWRNTCFAWAAANVLLGLPMNLLLLPRPVGTTGLAAAQALQLKPSVPFDRRMVLIAFAFASAWIVTGAMAAHFPRLLEASGATAAQAIAAGALIGPAQVAARMLEAGFLSRFHPLVSARIATITHPIGAAVLLTAGGGVASSAFAMLHGSGNGVLTIARGTVPLSIFGPENYGYRLGLIGAPARISQAFAPLGFGLLIDQIGADALWVSAALSLMALCALCVLRSEEAKAGTGGKPEGT
jgi:predicted MFS family arabinose efflux permease